ncbi:MAG: SAM-dependent methyltransferase [Myxococcota bacterium]|nr:SAM-dependent methyltransferase [Myxococcota bacterium]
MPLPLQEPRPFSRSLLWELMADRYESAGPELWAEGLPHQATANPWQARAIADLVVALALDTGEPVTVLDAGSGPGRFAFYLLLELQDAWERHDRSFDPPHVRLLDLAAANVDFSLEHPALAPFVARGWLSGQAFNATAPALDAPLPGPTVLVCNYLLDSLPVDVFNLVDGGPLERWVALSMADDGEPGSLDDLIFSYHDQPLGSTELPPVWRDWLQELHAKGQRGSVHLPTGALPLLEWARQASPRGLLTVITDKNWASPEHYVDDPLRPHAGTLSSMVDHPSLDRWVRAQGGAVWSSAHTDLQLISRAHAFHLPDTPRLKLAWELGLGRDSGLNAYSAQLQELPPDARTCLRLLRLSNFDPWAYRRMHSAVYDAIQDELPAWVRQGWLDALDQVWRREFLMEAEPDLAFAIGSIFMQLDAPMRALQLFSVSQERFGLDGRLAYNAAACWVALGQRERARAFAQQALELDPGLESARLLLAAL